jgi:hypothetical protein
VSDHLNSKKLKSFVAVKANLQAIEGYRNNVAHFYSEDLLPCVFTLVARCALNFVEFIKVSFSKDIMLDEGLFILPLGFSLPFQPEDFLSKTSPAYTSSSEARRFIDSIVTVIESLKNDGIEDSIVLGFDVYLQNIKKPENSDLLMKITSNGSSSIKISTVKSIRISNDPNAQSMKMDDEVFLDIYPHTYDNVSKWCKENISYFKQGKVFHSVMKSIKRNPEYAAVRKLNPRSNSSAAQTFYASVALNEIKRQYEEQGAAQ